MSLEFYVVTNCPMKGLYRNIKMAKRQCQRYEEAVLHVFNSPKEIAAARSCCIGAGIKVSKKTWDDLHVAGKMSSITRIAYKTKSAELTNTGANTEDGNDTQAIQNDTVTETKLDTVTKIIDITTLAETRNNKTGDDHKAIRIRRKRKKYDIDITNPMLPQGATAVVFTDGSFIKTDKRKYGGYAALILLRKMGDAELMISGHRRKAKSSEYMELLAINKALKRLKRYKISGKVVLYCDFKNIVESYNTTLPKWKKAHWQLETGKRVRFWKLWRKIWRKAKSFDLEVHWVKGHAGSIWNMRCDHAARVEAQILAM